MVYWIRDLYDDLHLVILIEWRTTVMVKIGPGPQNWSPPGTNFSINKHSPERILLQNMDSL